MHKHTIAALLLTATTKAAAGCIGPVIMGTCQGQSVPWDTHPATIPLPSLPMQAPAPAGFYWDYRGTPRQRYKPEWINPFTGRDAHNSDWNNIPR